MRKNVILSAVAATVVTGVLMLSGCTSSGAKTKTIVDDKDVPSSTVDVVPANGKLTFSGSAENKSAGGIDFTGTNATSKAGKDCTVDPCTVTIKKGCGKEAGKVLNYTNSCAVKTAYDALDATGPSAAAGKEFRYAGFVDISSDDIASCTVSFSADLKCSLDRDGQVATNTTGSTGSTGAGSAGEKAAGSGEALYVYVNPDTAPAGSKVAIYIVPADGCSTNGTGYWAEGTVAYRADGTAYVQTEVNIDDIPARVYFFVEEFSQVDANDAATGSTGGSN
jgi:hypothetical protein